MSLTSEPQSRLGKLSYFISRFLGVILLLLIFFSCVVSLFVHYQASLLIIEHLSGWEKFKFILPTLCFYLGITYWYIVHSYGEERYFLFKRLLLFASVTALFFLNTLLIVHFSQVGDNASPYILYYFLTDFTYLKPSLLQFQVFIALLLLPFIFSSLWFGYKKWQGSLCSKFLLVSVYSVLLLSFFSFSSYGANSNSSNLISHTLPRFFSTPSVADFNQPLQKELAPKSISSAQEKLNIVIIVMESTRRDAISAYNPDLAYKTPFFDALAEQSLLFNRAHSAIPHTSKALVSILCGVFPYPNMSILESVHGMPTECLAQQLGKLGYQTAFMQSATHYFENRKSLVEQFGFEHFFSAEDVEDGRYKKHYFGFDDEMMLDENESWLSAVDSPFFATYLTVGTHWPYELNGVDEQNEYFERSYQGLRLFDLQKPFNNYLNLVNRQDSFLQNLIQQYKDAGLYENTAFIILADHGESFGEHYPLQHNNNLYPEVLDIPMLIHLPFAPEQRGEVNTLFEQADILTIVGNILNAKAPLATIEHEAVFSACWYWRWCIARTDEHYRYIYHFDNAADELYDIAADPKMLKNIASKHSEKVNQYKDESLAWYQQQLSFYGQFFLTKDKHFFKVGSPGGTNLSTHQQR